MSPDARVPAKPVVTLQQIEAMPAAEARVLVARDAIALLDSGFVLARQGAYLMASGAPDPERDDTRSAEQVVADFEQAPEDEAHLITSNVEFAYAIEATAQVRDVLNDQAVVCAACALGTMLVAAVRRFDALTVGDVYSTTPLRHGCRDRVTTYLERLFCPEQLDLIEVAFECSTRFVNTDIGQRELSAAYEFGVRHATADERLRAILANVVEHGGEFRPRGVGP